MGYSIDYICLSGLHSATVAMQQPCSIAGIDPDTGMRTTHPPSHILGGAPIALLDMRS